VSELLKQSEPADGVAVLTLNRPERKNALSVALRDAVSDALDKIAADTALAPESAADTVRAIVLTGAGDTFCAGFDLREFEIADPEFQKQLWASSDRFHRRCLTFPLPIIAAINGAALAGGFDLAVMCDLRVAARTAWFSHPELAFSEVVYGPLHELVGGGVARELALTGRRVEADEALRIGLVNRIVEPDATVAAALDLARDIARAPRAVVIAMKRKIIDRAGIATGATLDL
jgi:enoyl-CoA hydratase